MVRSQFVLFSMALSLLAQPVFEQSPAPDPSVIRVTTRLVEVNVIVRDNHGPLAGLSSDDFTLFDRGKPQKIAFFSANSAQKSGVSPANSVATLAPGVFTNRPDERVASPASVTVVLLDGLNTRIQDQVYAKKQFVKFLSQIRPEDRVAVYTLGAALHVLSDFTNDSKRLVAAVAKFNGENLPFVEASEPDPSDSGSPDLDVRLNEAFGAIADQAIATRVRTTSTALISIAKHLSHLPGRKNLVWLTSSFPFSLSACGGENPTNWNAQVTETSMQAAGTAGQPNCMAPGQDLAAAGAVTAGARAGRGPKPVEGGPSAFMQPNRENVVFDIEIRRAMKALNDADVAIYPVDARGLVSLPKQFTAAMGPITRGVAGGGAPAAHADLAPTGISVMEMVAGDTGGRAFYNTNDINRAIRTAVDDSEITYTLGFYPDSKLLDSQFHSLKVHVDRKDVELRYRKGYTAFPESVQTEGDREQAIRDAVWSPLAATGITLNAKVDKVEQPKPGSRRIVVTVELSQLSFEAAADKRNAGVEIAFAQRSADGHDLGMVEQSAPIHLDESRYQSGQPITLTKTITPADGASEIRIVLHDRTSGRLGSLVVPIK